LLGKYLPHDGTRKILDSYGISYSGMKASKLEKHHLKNFDGIVAMDEENLSDILKLRDKNSTAWVKLLSGFVKENWLSVPDPYYTGDFELTYRLVTDGCKKLLENILKGETSCL
jgi:protein-tyrosine phosphatase